MVLIRKMKENTHPIEGTFFSRLYIFLITINLVLSIFEYIFFIKLKVFLLIIYGNVVMFTVLFALLLFSLIAFHSSYFQRKREEKWQKYSENERRKRHNHIKISTKLSIALQIGMIFILPFQFMAYYYSISLSDEQIYVISLLLWLGVTMLCYPFIKNSKYLKLWHEIEK